MSVALEWRARRIFNMMVAQNGHGEHSHSEKEPQVSCWKDLCTLWVWAYDGRWEGWPHIDNGLDQQFYACAVPEKCPVIIWYSAGWFCNVHMNDGGEEKSHWQWSPWKPSLPKWQESFSPSPHSYPRQLDDGHFSSTPLLTSPISPTGRTFKNLSLVESEGMEDTLCPSLFTPGYPGHLPTLLPSGF